MLGGMSDAVRDFEIPDDLQACLRRDESGETVTALVRAGHKAGVTETPTVVVAGRIYPGMKSLPELRGLVEEELLPGLLERFAPTFHERGRSFERDRRDGSRAR